MQTKRCNKCDEVKAISEFFKDAANKTDGHYSICKNCKMVSTVSWRERNREQYNAGMREYRKNNYQRMRLQRYKITPDQYQKMFSDQRGKCGICGKIQRGKRPLAIDHCHKNGNVRGLLCYGCNRAIHILDRPDLLASALVYLKRDDVN